MDLFLWFMVLDLDFYQFLLFRLKKPRLGHKAAGGLVKSKGKLLQCLEVFNLAGRRTRAAAFWGKAVKRLQYTRPVRAAAANTVAYEVRRCAPV